MAPSTKYHKRSHSLSEVLRFSYILKNAGSVYYRRYSIRTTAFLKMTQEVFVRGSSMSTLVIFNQSGMGMTLNSSVVVLSMTLNSCGAIEEMIL